MAGDDIIVQIRAAGVDDFVKGLKKAETSVDDVGDAVVENEKKVAASTTKMSGSYKKVGLAIAGAFSTAAIAKFIQLSVKAADVQLKAEAQLLTALKGREDIQKRLIKNAENLARATGISRNVLTQQQAYLAGLGFTETRIRQVIKAATDLAAGANQSLDTSVKQLAKTYGGLTGELGEQIPKLKEFTKAELASGAAVKEVSKLYEGQAEILKNTGSRVSGLTNAVEQLQVEFGKAVIDGVAPLADALREVAEDESVIEVFRALGTIVGDSLEVLALAVRALGRLGGDLSDFLGLTQDATDGLAAYNEEQDKQNQLLIESTELRIAELEKIKARADATDDVLKQQEIFSDAQANELDGYRESLILLRQTAEGYASQKKAASDLLEILTNGKAPGAGDPTTLVGGFALLRRELSEASKELDNLSPFDAGFDDALARVQLLTDKLADLNEAAKIEAFGENIVGPEIEPVTDGIIQIDEDALTDQLVTLPVGLKEEGLKKQKEAQDAFDAQEKADAKKQAEELQNVRAEKALAGIEAINQIQQTAFNAFSVGIQNQIGELEERKEKGIISEKEYEEERAALLTKQAKAEKASNIVQSIVNTAVGITKTIAQLGFPAAIPFVAIAAALGVAQTAIIAAQPIPKFAEGTRSVERNGAPRGKDTVLAYVNEGERIIPTHKNTKHWAMLNAVEDNNIEAMMKALAGYGVPVQFQPMADRMNMPLKKIEDITKGTDMSKIDWDPMINSSFNNARSLGKKLDRLNGSFEKLGRGLTHRMTKN